MTGWETAEGNNVTSEVLFHWLVTMLSGRTVRQFSEKEIGQLRHFQSRSAETGAGEWAAGVWLIYQLLDSALRPPRTRPGPDIDVSLLEKQFEDLGEDQRRPLLQLDLFLSGPGKDERWQRKLDDAKSRQHANNRLNWAWVFFWPAPVEVTLPQPGPVAGGRLWMLGSAVLASPVALALLWRNAVLGLLGYVVVLAGGIAVAAAELELRVYWERSRRQGEPPPVVGQGKSDLDEVIDKRFQKYFDRYGPDEIARGLWKNASAGVRRFYRDEVIGTCWSTGASIDEIDWFIRYEVHQMLGRGQDGTLRIPRGQPPARPAVPAVRRAGWVAVLVGCVLAVFALGVYAFRRVPAPVPGLPDLDVSAG